jgi:hypothetical protein
MKDNLFMISHVFVTNPICKAYSLMYPTTTPHTAQHHQHHHHHHHHPTTPWLSTPNTRPPKQPQAHKMALCHLLAFDALLCALIIWKIPCNPPFPSNPQIPIITTNLTHSPRHRNRLASHTQQITRPLRRARLHPHQRQRDLSSTRPRTSTSTPRCTTSRTRARYSARAGAVCGVVFGRFGVVMACYRLAEGVFYRGYIRCKNSLSGACAEKAYWGW